MFSCKHCGTEPSERRDTATGRLLVVCENCRARGEASANELRAWATWHLVSDETLPLHGCGTARPARFSQVEGKWFSRCACGFQDDGYATIEGAVAGWMRASRA